MATKITAEPSVVRPGQIFRLTVSAAEQTRVVFGKDMRMRPVDGTDQEKDDHTYWLVGALEPPLDGTAKYFGPRGWRGGTDEGYVPSHRLYFGAPPVAVPQQYRLTLDVQVGTHDAPSSIGEILQTILTVT